MGILSKAQNDHGLSDLSCPIIHVAWSDPRPLFQTNRPRPHYPIPSISKTGLLEQLIESDFIRIGLYPLRLGQVFILSNVKD
jgi:hypothetical protein